MKIAEININKHINQTTSFKAKITQLPKINVQNNAVSSINPNYYQNLYGISPSLLVNVYYDDAEDDILEIHSEDIKKYLCDKTGTINSARVKEFVFLYKLIAQGMKNEHKKEKERYVQSFNIQKNILSMTNNNEDEQADDDAFVRTQLKGLDDSEITSIKEAILYAMQQEYDKIPYVAYQRTLRLFQLSKTNEGYDFSLLDKKLDIIEDIEEMQYEYAMHYSIDELYNEIIDASKDEDGNIDLSLISESFNMIFQLGFIVSPKYVINLVKKYISKNPHNKAKILDVMNKLNKTDFNINSETTNFEELMDLCFQGYHFNSKKADKMLELTKYAKIWIDIKQQNTEYKSIDRAISRYRSYLVFCTSVIKDYFEESKDKYGNYDFDKIDIKEFFDIKTKGIEFI